MPATLLLATRNRHKAAEICAILGVKCLALDAFPDAPVLVEDADTFAGNASGKASQLARWLRGRNAGSPPSSGCSPTEARGRGQPGTGGDATADTRWFVLADDSGLEVDALNGAPGVHSARFAALDKSVAGNSTDAENNAKLLRLLREVPWEQRKARFRCVLALVPMQGTAGGLAPMIFEGVCEGRLGLALIGQGGFGYDPLFIPEGFEESFAELGEAAKNRISHRARALAKLHEWIGANA